MYLEYKATCSSIGDIEVYLNTDISPMNKDNLKIFIMQLTDGYKRLKRCVDQRQSHTEKCVHQVVRDQGHEYHLNYLKSIQQRYDSLVEQARQKLVYLDVQENKNRVSTAQREKELQDEIQKRKEQEQQQKEDDIYEQQMLLEAEHTKKELENELLHERQQRLFLTQKLMQQEQQQQQMLIHQYQSLLHQKDRELNQVKQQQQQEIQFQQWMSFQQQHQQQQQQQQQHMSHPIQLNPTYQYIPSMHRPLPMPTQPYQYTHTHMYTPTQPLTHTSAQVQVQVPPPPPPLPLSPYIPSYPNPFTQIHSSSYPHQIQQPQPPQPQPPYHRPIQSRPTPAPTFLNDIDSSFQRLSMTQSSTSVSSSTFKNSRERQLTQLDETLFKMFGYLDVVEYTPSIDVAIFASIGLYRREFSISVRLAQRWGLIENTQGKNDYYTTKQFMSNGIETIRALFKKWSQLWIGARIHSYCYPIRYFQYYCTTYGFKSFLTYQLSQPVFTDSEVSQIIEWLMELFKVPSFQTTVKNAFYNSFSESIQMMANHSHHHGRINSSSSSSSSSMSADHSTITNDMHTVMRTLNDTIYLEISQKEQGSRDQDIIIKPYVLFNIPNKFKLDMSTWMYQPISTIYFTRGQNPNHEVPSFPYKAAFKKTQETWLNSQAILPPVHKNYIEVAN